MSTFIGTLRKRGLLNSIGPVLLGFALLSDSCLAADTAAIDKGDTAWILTSTALVLFMTLPGLALFYAGLVRAKNVLSVLMQCFSIACAVSIVWMIAGYSLALTDGGPVNGFLGGLSRFMFIGLTADSVSGTIPESLFAMFQMTFAIIAVALIVGGFAERVRFASVMAFSMLWLIFVYLPVCHWIWGGGWLSSLGFMDFAGGAVIHINAGVAALVCAIVLGNRTGFPRTQMPPHNLPMTVTGASMLWVGWFGFNAGSALAADGAAGMAMLVTHIGAAAGSLAWVAMEWRRFGKPSVLGIVTGMVAGLGTITPASGFVGPIGALIIGIAAGVLCFLATQRIKKHYQIDDSLDVFPVHGVGGIVGTVLTAIFAMESLGGMGLAEGRSVLVQLLVQILGVAATAVWCGLATYLILRLLGIDKKMRVSAEQEHEGLDLVLHDERGYNL